MNSPRAGDGEPDMATKANLEPFLANSEQDVQRFGSVAQRLGTVGAIQSLVVSMLGTGIVAFPYGFALCGYIVAPIALCTIGFLAHLSYMRLVNCTAAQRCSSYGGLLQEVPRGWKVYTNLSLWMLLVLVAAAYTLIAGDIIKSVAASMHVQMEEVALLQNRNLFGLLLLIVFPASLPKGFDGLTFISTYCTLAIVVTVILLVWQAYALMVSDPPPAEQGMQPITNVQNCMLAVPIFACSMFGHMNISQIYAELRPNLKARAPQISIAAILISGLLYLVLGMFGYAAFGRLAAADVMAQLTASQGESPIIALTQILLTSFVVLKTPLVILPLRTVTLEMVLSTPGDIDQISTVVHVGVTALLISAVYVVVVAIGDFGKVLELLGAVCVIPLTFIVPARLSWTLEEPRPTKTCLLLATCGVVFSGLSLTVIASGK